MLDAGSAPSASATKARTLRAWRLSRTKSCQGDLQVGGRLVARGDGRQGRDRGVERRALVRAPGPLEAAQGAGAEAGVVAVGGRQRRRGSGPPRRRGSARPLRRSTVDTRSDGSTPACFNARVVASSRSTLLRSSSGKSQRSVAASAAVQRVGEDAADRLTLLPRLGLEVGAARVRAGPPPLAVPGGLALAEPAERREDGLPDVRIVGLSELRDQGHRPPSARGTTAGRGRRRGSTPG